MEHSVERIIEAVKHIKIADHILTTTYPVVNDPKILLSVVENIRIALSEAISASVYFERNKKQIPIFHDTDEGRLEVFQSKIAPKNNISEKSIELIEEINEIISEHKKSPMVFSREKNFVIAGDEFKKLKILNAKEVKELLVKAKLFIVDVNNKFGKK